MSLKHGLLGLLNYGANTGYDLDKIFKHSLSFFWNAQTSQIYRELTTLEESGFLSSEIEYQTASPNKKIYSITGSGREELHRWLTDEATASNAETRNSFLMKMFFAGEASGENAVRLLHAFMERNEAALNAMEEVENHVAHYSQHVEGEKAAYWKLVAEYGKRLRKLNIEWAKHCMGVLGETR